MAPPPSAFAAATPTAAPASAFAAPVTSPRPASPATASASAPTAAFASVCASLAGVGLEGLGVGVGVGLAGLVGCWVGLRCLGGERGRGPRLFGCGCGGGACEHAVEAGHRGSCGCDLFVAPRVDDGRGGCGLLFVGAHQIQKFMGPCGISAEFLRCGCAPRVLIGFLVLSRPWAQSLMSVGLQDLPNSEYFITKKGGWSSELRGGGRRFGWGGRDYWHYGAWGWELRDKRGKHISRRRRKERGLKVGSARREKHRWRWKEHWGLWIL